MSVVVRSVLQAPDADSCAACKSSVVLICTWLSHALQAASYISKVFACQGEENMETPSVSCHLPSGPPLASQTKQGFAWWAHVKNPNVTANSARSPLTDHGVDESQVQVRPPASSRCRSLARLGSMVCLFRGWRPVWIASTSERVYVQRWRTDCTNFCNHTHTRSDP